ncbi:XTP/dITP diphosphatase [Candidatus Bathyarchaeota archaeon]|nr:MAG: XTP/dITP diphosphatase [Candidatus Bathyarchaeota archaeon]
MNKVRFPLKGKLIFFVTRNINKFNEARRVLADEGIATAMIKLETLEIQSNSLEDIAKFRALDAVKKSNLPVIVEDAGLFIEALKGFPGPYSSYVYRTIGRKGLLTLLKKTENRKAFFKSVVAYSEPGGDVQIFSGMVEGEIAHSERGRSGFGFDPIFKPLEGDGRTFGEMTTEEKNRISHRSRALKKFADWYRSVDKS